MSSSCFSALFNVAFSSVLTASSATWAAVLRSATARHHSASPTICVNVVVNASSCSDFSISCECDLCSWLFSVEHSTSSFALDAPAFSDSSCRDDIIDRCDKSDWFNCPSSVSFCTRCLADSMRVVASLSAKLINSWWPVLATRSSAKFSAAAANSFFSCFRSLSRSWCSSSARCCSSTAFSSIRPRRLSEAASSFASNSLLASAAWTSISLAASAAASAARCAAAPAAA